MATSALAPAQRSRAIPILVVLLGTAVVLNYIDRGAVGVAAPLMKSDLGLTATEIGVAISAFFWVYAPIQLGLGWLCDRWSVYKLLALGTVLWSISTVMMGFVAGFLSLFLLRLILGVGESIVFPGSSKIICRHVPAERRGIANAVVSMGVALGPAIGTLAGGSMAAAFGWRAMFVVFGLLSALWLLPWASVTGALSTEATPTEAPFPVGKLLRRWSLWATGVGHATSNYGFYFLLAFLPLYLVQQRGLSIIQMTMLATVGYCVQAASALAFGTISDRWTRAGGSEARIRRALLIGGHLIYGFGIIAIPLVHSLAVVVALLCLLGACGGAVAPNLYAVGQMFAGPRASGTWIGIQNAVGNLSGIFGPALSGVIIDRAGYGSAFGIAAAVSLFGAMWWAFAVPKIEEVELG